MQRGSYCLLFILICHCFFTHLVGHSEGDITIMRKGKEWRGMEEEVSGSYLFTY